MAQIPAPFPVGDDLRVAALHALSVLDTPPEQEFDDIVELATTIANTPIALVSLIDTERQWFKACLGLPVEETHRDLAFCAHAILTPDDLLVVEDATQDPRFNESVFVTGPPHIRFYAGAPIVTHDGFALGTVCVIDTIPRSFTAGEARALKTLARQTAALMHLRKLTLSNEANARSLSKKLINALVDNNAAHGDLRHRQRIATVGEMTSGIAHDFNNLLHAIGMNLQLVRRKADDPIQVRRFADAGLAAVSSGSKLIARLLSFSRVDASNIDKLCVATQVGHLEEFLGRVLAPEVHLHFDLTASGELVLCDCTQLEVALLNLIINARDAMNNAGNISVSSRTVSLTADGELPDGRYVELSVSDDGPGMTPETAQRVFEPFFTTKPEGKGTGLGLSQVFGFALASSGSARIRSEPGKGTSVTLLLRTVEAEAV